MSPTYTARFCEKHRFTFWTATLPTRRNRWIYRWRCITRWTYMRQTWVFGHGRLIEWWWNR